MGSGYFSNGYWSNNYYPVGYWGGIYSTPPAAPPQSVTTTTRTHPYKVKKHRKGLLENPQFVAELVEFLEMI